MSRRSSTSPKLELELNLSPPRPNESRSNSNTSETPSEMSVEGSCVSSESGQYKGSKEIIRSMMLVGCPRCLMYVMLSDEADPKCPKCKSKVLLDFLNDKKFTNTSGI
ncbi:hypothetical protein FNV43_RR17728 [Rhamnella rubrinervis]|uniref:GIR1-like zinc ribbon domain-containing protein n=1 Tax=Rhamnella rubrinervis TaxID=2594499 RepID=A0A8K0GXX7_9ROSA|nr:hypothetical protein FNV43_RR17728 [Rhamnella rubrinervis]